MRLYAVGCGWLRLIIPNAFPRREQSAARSTSVRIGSEHTSAPPRRWAQTAAAPAPPLVELATALDVTVQYQVIVPIRSHEDRRWRSSAVEGVGDAALGISSCPTMHLA